MHRLSRNVPKATLFCSPVGSHLKASWLLCNPLLQSPAVQTGHLPRNLFKEGALRADSRRDTPTEWRGLLG